MIKSYVTHKLNSGRNIFNDNPGIIYKKDEAIRIKAKYPDRIPVIVVRSTNAGTSVPQIDKHKFLVPSDLTMGQFQYVIRNRLRLSPEKALFLFVNGTLAPTSNLMTTIYEEHRDPDTMFLFFTYAMENTFG
jgi:GABA(A) receptor-associated protein